MAWFSIGLDYPLTPTEGLYSRYLLSPNFINRLQSMACRSRCRALHDYYALCFIMSTAPTSNLNIYIERDLKEPGCIYIYIYIVFSSSIYFHKSRMDTCYIVLYLYIKGNIIYPSTVIGEKHNGFTLSVLKKKKCHKNMGKRISSNFFQVCNAPNRVIMFQIDK